MNFKGLNKDRCSKESGCLNRFILFGLALGVSACVRERKRGCEDALAEPPAHSSSEAYDSANEGQEIGPI